VSKIAEEISVPDLHLETRYGYLNGSAAPCIVIIMAELINIDIQDSIKRGNIYTDAKPTPSTTLHLLM
jgi:hypothetical protein